MTFYCYPDSKDQSHMSAVEGRQPQIDVWAFASCVLSAPHQTIGASSLVAVIRVDKELLLHLLFLLQCKAVMTVWKPLCSVVFWFHPQRTGDGFSSLLLSVRLCCFSTTLSTSCVVCFFDVQVALLELLCDAVASSARQGKGLVVSSFPRDLSQAQEYEAKARAADRHRERARAQRHE